MKHTSVSGHTPVTGLERQHSGREGTLQLCPALRQDCNLEPKPFAVEMCRLCNIPLKQHDSPQRSHRLQMDKGSRVFFRSPCQENAQDRGSQCKHGGTNLPLPIAAVT